MIVHVTRRNGKTDHGSLDEPILLQAPKEVLLLECLIFLRREPYDAVEIFRQATRLIKSQEVERTAFSLEQPLLYYWLADFAICLWQLLQARIVLKLEALEVSRAVLDSPRLV